MGQQEIFDFFRRNKGTRFTSGKLMEIFDTTRNSINKSCNKLARVGFIKKQEIIENHKNKTIYWYE